MLIKNFEVILFQSSFSFVQFLHPALAWSLASDWSRHITWPEYWPLIGLCHLCPMSDPCMRHDHREEGRGAVDRRGHSGVHCWKQQISAIIKIAIKTDYVAYHRFILQARGPDINITLFFSCCYLLVENELDRTWFGTCCCCWWWVYYRL